MEYEHAHIGDDSDYNCIKNSTDNKSDKGFVDNLGKLIEIPRLLLGAGCRDNLASACEYCLLVVEKVYRNQEKAIKMSEQILDGKKISKADQEFARKYSVDYAPIFGAVILDLDENSVFAVKSYNQKTGIVTLKDEKTGIELPVKVIKVKGQWLIEGAGTVNIPN